MWESFFGFKKPPFSDHPDAKQVFSSTRWRRSNECLQFLTDHRGVALLTGEVGAGKSTAARMFTAGLNPNLYKVLYILIRGDRLPEVQLPAGAGRESVAGSRQPNPLPPGFGGGDSSPATGMTSRSPRRSACRGTARFR